MHLKPRKFGNGPSLEKLSSTFIVQPPTTDQRPTVNSYRHGRNKMLVNVLIDCPVLLSSVDLSVSRGTRSRTIFQRRHRSTYYSYHSGLSRLLRTGSDIATHVDFFNESVVSFKCKVASII
ncbi:hypothetical protein J6590_082905 [Homalodisca vitripennis]|nr:hypothetical protein J6590_082905 [Homalodisca vitripennis]